MEPKDRLRLARQAARLTPEELADRSGFAVSTVRAHENGQNQIRARAAEKYGTALVVSASWILFGEGMGPKEAGELAADLHQVPVIGLIRHGAWLEMHRSVETSVDIVPIFLPEYKAHQLIAFEMSQDYGKYPSGAFVFLVDDSETTLLVGDEVVASRMKSGLSENGIWELFRDGLGEEKLIRRNKVGGIEEQLSWDAFYVAEAEEGGSTPRENVIQGVVVACQWTRRVAAFKPTRDG